MEKIKNDNINYRLIEGKDCFYYYEEELKKLLGDKFDHFKIEDKSKLKEELTLMFLKEIENKEFDVKKD